MVCLSVSCCLQTRGLIAFHCTVEERSIRVSLLLVEEPPIASQEMTLVESLGDREYRVLIPAIDTQISHDVELQRIGV
jgi:hypothetical protein